MFSLARNAHKVRSYSNASNLHRKLVTEFKKNFSFGKRFFKSAEISQKKPYYVTTPIFYVNASPHIGHLHSMVLADTLKNWAAFAHPNISGSFLTTGTDEHGLKVQQAADAAKQLPKPFVDQASEIFKQLAKVGEISYDRFIRTTDEDHIRASKEIWQILEKNGYIYKGQHSGWYSISDETFYPENQVEKKKVIKMGPSGEEIENEVFVSVETGKTVEWTSEENFFFSLSKIQPRLLNFLKENPEFIYPKARYQQILNEVEAGLPDLSISRPKTRCSWGIPVPGEEDSQVMYVWLDALTNYLTSAGFPWNGNNGSLWPADVHVIGKDIIRFHAIYWPAFLLAANIPPPKHIVVHSHWIMKGSKMSKSLGNVVDPFSTIKAFGVDSVKFFLMNDSFLNRDSEYSNDRIILRHNTELVNKYGNLIARICGKNFNISRALATNIEEKSKLATDINDVVEKVKTNMNAFNTSGALHEIQELISNANSYMQDSEPWKLKNDLKKQDSIIRDVSEAARVASIMLTPFIPKLSHAMLDRLAVNKAHRGIEFAKYLKDKNYGMDANRKGDHPIKPIVLDH